jgi:hypothetical protein
VSESDLSKYQRYAKGEASELLRKEGLLPDRVEKAITRGEAEDEDVQLYEHVLKILVNAMRKARLCAGPRVLAAKDPEDAALQMMRATRAAMSRSAKKQLGPDRAALVITEPLQSFLHSKAMRDACEDKDGIMQRMRRDVRRRWKEMLDLRSGAERAWRALEREDPAFASSIDEVAVQSWKTLLLTALAMGGAAAAGISAEKLRRKSELRAKLHAAAAGARHRNAAARSPESASIAEAAEQLLERQPTESWLSRSARTLLGALGAGTLLLALQRAKLAEGPRHRSEKEPEGEEMKGDPRVTPEGQWNRASVPGHFGHALN